MYVLKIKRGGSSPVSPLLVYSHTYFSCHLFCIDLHIRLLLEQFEANISTVINVKHFFMLLVIVIPWVVRLYVEIIHEL